MLDVISPLRGGQFVDENGVPLARVMQWIESITGAVKPGDVQAKSTAYQLLGTDAGVICNTDSGSFTITLPDATKVKGKEYFVQNASTTGTVTIDTFENQLVAGSDLIQTASTLPYSAPHLKSDGSNWVLLGFIGDSTKILVSKWVTDLGEQMITDDGAELIFV